MQVGNAETVTKSKSAKPDLCYPGREVNFTITLHVQTEDPVGPLPIENLTIIDYLPPNMTYVGGSQNSIPASSFSEFLNGSLFWDFGQGPHIGLIRITFNATVNLDTDLGKFIQNVAVAKFQQVRETPLPQNIESITENIFISSAVLDIDKVGTPGPIHEGDLIEYNITLTNTGDADAIGLTVEDVLDDVIYITASATSGTIGYTDPVLTWSGDIPAGGTVNITIQVLDDPVDISQLVENTAEYITTPEEYLFIKTEDSCSTTVIHPKIRIEKTYSKSSSVEPSNVTFTYLVQNIGDTPLYGVTVVDTPYGPITLLDTELDVLETTYGEHKEYDLMKGSYYNEATATGTDILGGEAEDTDSATCIIPGYVGGEIMEIYGAAERITLMVITALTTIGALFFVHKKH